jgi:hypothetical protein
MMRIALLFSALAALGLAGCKDKPRPPEPPEAAQPAEPRSVQIEEQRVRVMNNPDEVKRDVENTIEAGLKARERQMGE